MFTGIVQAVGTLRSLEPRGGDVRLWVATGKLEFGDVKPGDSIAVSGACLTAVELEPAAFAADVSKETLSRTTLGERHAGDRVNLEKALALGDRLGGHLVSGHVDGIGTVHAREASARSVRFEIEAPDSLARYIAEKGSIAVEGVSLTVNTVQGGRFALNVVPHTLAETTLDKLKPGSRVNLEVDLIARYLERLLLGERAGEAGGRVTAELLARAGFIK